MLYFSLYYPIHRFFISPTLACLHKKKMIIYLPLLLFTGLAFGVDDSDLIIFRNGLEYYGDFLKVKTDTVYFKPQNSNAYQNVFTFQLDSSEGQIICKIPRIPLGEGTYSINLQAIVNTGVADWINDAGTFEILPGDYYKTGIIEPTKANFYCDSKWEN